VLMLQSLAISRSALSSFPDVPASRGRTDISMTLKHYQHHCHA
jgi:hypothetical protein